MSAHDRTAFIAAYVSLYGGTTAEADQILRGVEITYAERQNAELAEALDAADGEHLRQTEELRQSNAVLQRMLERMPEKHMRFNHLNPDGTVSEAGNCADWCYACKLEKLRSEVGRLEAELNQRSAG
jgi:hypothetical protein